MRPLPFPFAWVVDASLQMSVLIVVLRCARPWLRRFAGSGAVAGLWLLVAMRLLLPWPVVARWSLPIPWIAPVARTPESPTGQPPSWTMRAKVEAAPDAHPEKTASGPSRAAAGVGQEKASGVLEAFWLGGMFLALARLAQGWRRTLRWATRTPPGRNDACLARAFAAIAPTLRRNVGARATDALEVPALAGVFRPCIWVPRVWLDRLDEEGLRHVLLHELGHARRHDLLAQWLCALAGCVHWFNPLVWLLARSARTDRELACDGWVLARGGAEGRGDFPAAYGRTLIRVAAKPVGNRPSVHRQPFGAVTMAAGKRQLGLRVREIGACRVCSPWRGMAAGGITAAVAVAVMTVGRAVPPAQPPPPTTLQVVAPGIYLLASEQSTPSPALLAAPAAPSTPAAPPASPGLPPEKLATAAPAPSPAAGSIPAGRPAEAQVSIESKIISLSREAARQLQAGQAHSPGRIRQFADQIAGIAAGEDVTKGAPPANFCITQLLPKQDFDGLIRGLNQLKGVDLLSAPRVTTKSGQKATLEIINEIVYATGIDHTSKVDGKIVPTTTRFDKKNTGVTLTVIPDIAPARDVVDLNVSWQMVNLEGWVRASDGKPFAPDKPDRSDARPVFVTQAIDTFITMPADSVLVLGSLRQHPGTWYDYLSHPQAPAGAETLLLTFISLKILDPSGAPPPAPIPAAAAPPTSSVPSPGAAVLPRGVPVPGKPGFVTSPYAPDGGYVDVHGFARDTEVRDPYTGKLFLVP